MLAEHMFVPASHAFGPLLAPPPVLCRELSCLDAPPLCEHINRFDTELMGTFMRIHLRPQIVIKAASQLVHITHSCIGTLTDSRSAGAAGCIPLLDTARVHSAYWKSLCFRASGRMFALVTFVDNLLATGSSPEDTTCISDDCEAYLAG